MSENRRCVETHQLRSPIDLPFYSAEAYTADNLDKTSDWRTGGQDFIKPTNTASTSARKACSPLADGELLCPPPPVPDDSGLVGPAGCAPDKPKRVASECPDNELPAMRAANATTRKTLEIASRLAIVARAAGVTVGATLNRPRSVNIRAYVWLDVSVDTLLVDVEPRVLEELLDPSPLAIEATSKAHNEVLINDVVRAANELDVSPTAGACAAPAMSSRAWPLRDTPSLRTSRSVGLECP
jgi:hypothetical protein